MDIGRWLRNLGLGQYEAVFRDNEIDGEVLPNLTTDDLKELGVAIVGHRRKLLTAIAELFALAAAPAPVAPPAEASPASAQAERRPITVMFCDLVGSTSLAARLDPEDWRNLVGSYLDAASAAVTSLGGHVLKKLGDGLMALFGYPQAQENDGERAVRAALAIQRALVDLNARNAATGAPELAARIGLESGRVVVDHTGEVYGEAPNVAARVQSAAAPGEIWITRAVHRQIAGLFVAEDKGEHELKGVPEKTQLYRIVRVSGGGRRGGSRAPTPLVGRGEELDILARRWERARRGEGQLVLITGEPGLGKSRLIEEFRGRLAETPHTWVEWASSQLLQNTPLHPATEWGRARFGGAEVAGERQYAELEAALASVGLDAAEYAPLLAPVIDAPTPPGRAPKLSPEELRSRQLAALTAWLLAGARTQPLVFAFEDLHWADPTSLDVLQALAERGAQAPLLIIATTRPEFRPPWKLRSHHGVISLAPLDSGEIVRMVGEIATRHALSKDVIAGVSERTGGVPLFIEEVTRLLLERGEQGGVQAIPPTLQQSLAARLDRLGPAREIAQIGAVLGRGFSHALLRDVAGLDEPALGASLDKLADAELLFVEGVPPHANYRFKHALIQDAAYDSLLKSRRQTLHRRAAEVLLASPAPEAEALAHHFTQAGQTELAIEWWGKSGDQALRRSAFAEAISHLGKAIELSDKAGGAARGKEGAGDKLKLRVSYGNALLSGRGYGAPETRAAFERARETAATPESALERFSIDYGLWSGAHLRGELPSMREMSQAFLRTCESRPESPESGIAHRLCGTTHWYAGEFAQARTHLDRALAILDPDRDRDLAWRFGQDVVLSAKAFLAFTLWAIGEILEARAHSDDLLALASRSRHVPTVIFGFAANPIFEMVAGTRAPVWPNIEALVRLARDNGLQLWIAFGGFLESWALWRSGDREGRLVEMRRGIESWREHVGTLYIPVICARLAEAEAESGEIEAALATINAVIAETAQSGQCWFDAEVHRIRGEILVKQNPADSAPAEAAFLAAITVAQQQKARSFELRAALSLAKLYQSAGRAIEAHDVVGPALTGFAPTPEFPAIAEAKALFEALAADERVKADVARRAQRLKLQTDYGQAVMWSKGFVAEETKAAFARVGDLASGVGAAEAPFEGYYGLWVNSYFRGDIGSARETAESFLREAKRAQRATEIGVALRVLGLTLLWQGEFEGARDHLQQTLRICDPERDREAKFRFSNDTASAATVYLAHAVWCLGNVARARELIDEACARAVESAHAPTIANVHHIRSILEILLDDSDAVFLAAQTVLALSREHGLALYLAFGSLYAPWARAKLGDRDAGSTEFRRALAAYTHQGNKVNVPFYQGLLADLEAERGKGEAALAEIDGALALAGETGEHWFDSGLHRIRGEILLRQNPADPAAAEAAFLAATAVARQQRARSFELRAALSLAKLYKSTGRPIDAHDVMGPALQGFSPTPEFPQIAEAKALFEALAADETVKAQVARRAQRLKLQTDYGQAVIWGKGYAAEETKAAYARADELATEIGNAEAPFDAFYGRWGHALFRGELGSARETAESFLREAERAVRPTEAEVAHRILGYTRLLQGDLAEGRAHLEQAVQFYDPDRDRDAKFRFGSDARATATGYLAFAAWCLGDVGRARELIDESGARAIESAHAPTLANTYNMRAIVEILRNDAEAVRRAAEAAIALSREHGLPLHLAGGALAMAWARTKLSDRDAGSAELQRALADWASQGCKLHLPCLRGLLAEIEAETLGAEAALAGIDEALALAGETGEHWFDAGLHRIRGEILVKQNPADPGPAEAAFLAAIAVGRQQKARSFELRAALSLAKLYKSTGRPIEAHDVLGPALAGFSPTPEFPAIVEAMELLNSLAQTEEVKAANASLNRRLRLQVAYGNALISARGYSAPETRAAFERARALSGATDDTAGAYSASYGLWVSSLVRGELASIQEAANAFRHVASTNPLSPVAGVAHRIMGTTHWFAGEFVTARGHLERALAIFDPIRDADLNFVFGQDLGVSAKTFLVLTLWPMGEIDLARCQADEMIVRADQSGHVPTIVYGHLHKALFELMAHKPALALPSIERFARFARDNEMPMYVSYGEVLGAWADGYRGRPEDAANEMRRKINQWREQVGTLHNPLLAAMLAEIETASDDIDSALATIDQAIATSERTGQRWFDAGLHRIRGEILVKQNPADPAPAEAAFLAAIAVAQQQKARSFELRAALSLAKLYQSTGRPIDAHDVLGLALEGFAPTPEFPQIAEALEFVAAIKATGEQS